MCIRDRIWADAIFAWDLLNANSLALGMDEPKILGEVEAGACLLYTSDAADEPRCVDLGGRRIIKKKKDTASAQSLINI